MSDDPIARLRARLPRHWRMLDTLRAAVRDDERWRWLELGCSVGAGGGDDRSDLDVAIGYRVAGDGTDVEAAAGAVAAAVGAPLDMLVHRMPGSPDDVRRVAAEYPDGIQLDLVLMPADSRPGLPDRSVALVDKDGVLARGWTPAVREPPDAATANEWRFLAWWALSDADKYAAARESWFEAVESVSVARGHALRLYAAGRAIPYPSFGLVSLLDFPPYELPDGLADTYGSPADPRSVTASIESCAELLHHATRLAAASLGIELASGLRRAALGRVPR